MIEEETSTIERTKKLGRPRKLRPEYMQIDRLIEEGGSSSKIAEEVKLDKLVVYRYIRRSGKYAFWKEKRREYTEKNRTRLEIDNVIEKGLSLKQMGELVNPNICRERVRQYLMKSDQHDLWKQKREEVKNRNLQEAKETQEKRQDFFNSLCFYIYHRARQDGFAYEKAIEYDFKRKIKDKRSIPLEKLIRFFTLYEKAAISGEKLGLKELTERAELSCGMAGSRLLKTVNLIPLKKHIKRGDRYNTDAGTVERAYNLDFSAPDISYFLKLPINVIRLKFSRIGKRKKFMLNLPVMGHTNYRTVSQIYELQDSGFNLSEISQYLNIKRANLEYAIEHRDEIQEKIINVLNIIHGGKHEKPYL